MQVVHAGDAISQRYSVWKTLAIELIVLTIAIVPIAPVFPHRLIYAEFLYQWPYSLILYVSCAVLGIGFILLLPLLWRAIFGLPGVVVSGDAVIVYGIIGRSVKTSEVTKVSPMIYGSVTIKSASRSVTLPVFLLEEPDQVLTKLRGLFS